MEAPGELLAGEEQPQCVSRSKENRRVRKRRHISPEAAALTYKNLAAFEPTFKNATFDLAKTFDNSFIERAVTLRAK